MQATVASLAPCPELAQGGGVEVERQQASVAGIMSTATFEALDVAEGTRRAMAEMGHVQLTEVQARTIPALLLGRDVLGAAKTGSGKTLVTPPSTSPPSCY